MKKPAELYTPSARRYAGLPDVSYPFHDKTVTITNCGRICIAGQKIHLSTVFAGHDVGVRQVEDEVWLVSFMDYDLGYFDLESNKVQALDNPFGPKVLGVWAVKSVNHVLGIHLFLMVGRARLELATNGLKEVVALQKLI